MCSLDLAEYVALTDDAEKDKYKADAEEVEVDTVKYHVSINHTDYAAAKAAYDGKKAEYDQYVIDKKADDDAKKAYQEELALYQVELNKYNSLNEAYGLWHSYFQSLDNYNLALLNIQKNAARSTVVKKASFDTAVPVAGDTEGKTAPDANGFTDAEIVSGLDLDSKPVTGSMVFLPEGEGDGKVTIFARANHFRDEELLQKKNDYKDYLKIKGFDIDAAIGSTDPEILSKAQIGEIGRAHV